MQLGGCGCRVSVLMQILVSKPSRFLCRQSICITFKSGRDEGDIKESKMILVEAIGPILIALWLFSWDSCGALAPKSSFGNTYRVLS
jgi:hypothetical protein